MPRKKKTMTFTWKFDHSKENKMKIDNKSEQVRDKVCKVFKFASFTFCLIGFLLTSLAVFYNFSNGTTVISTIVDKSPNDMLDLPIILICNSSAYKEQTLNTSLHGYRRNTMSLDDALLAAFLVRRDPDEGVLDNELVPIMEHAYEVFTMTHGICIMFDLQIKMRYTDTFWMELNAEFDLSMYVVNPGDDIFAPFFLFPVDPLKTYLSQNIAWTQIRLTKETKRENSKECNSTKGYLYGECIKNHIKEYWSGPRREQLLNCTVPWMANLTGISISDNSHEETPCNTTQAAIQSVVMIDYFQRAITNQFPQCKEPCDCSSYKMQKVAYDTDSIITKHMHDYYKSIYNLVTPENVTSYTTMINFLTTDVTLSEEVKLSNFPDFVSSIGGNLGLFLGFSFLTLLRDLAEWAKKIPIRHLF